MFAFTEDASIIVEEKLTVHIEKVEDCIFIYSPFLASLKAQSIEFTLDNQHIIVNDYVEGEGVVTGNARSLIEYTRTGDYLFKNNVVICYQGSQFKLAYMREGVKYLCKELNCSSSSRHLSLY